MKIDYAAQCRFFSAEDAVRFALASYYAASRAIEPPPGEPWFDDGVPFASGGVFADEFVQELADRVSAAAYAMKVARSGSPIDGLWWPVGDEELTERREFLLRRIMNHLPRGDNGKHNA
ncbi:hypothetical protein, partial [Dyella marensis]